MEVGLARLARTAWIPGTLLVLIAPIYAELISSSTPLPHASSLIVLHGYDGPSSVYFCLV